MMVVVIMVGRVGRASRFMAGDPSHIESRNASAPTEWEAATSPELPIPATGAESEIPNSVGGYRIERRLGSGGMGDVFVAFDERLHRRVALKAIRVEHRLRPEARDRFLREARVLSRLDHPRICAIYDYLETPQGDFLVLELIQGEELGDALPRLTPPEKLHIAEQIADVLTAAHAAGIVHRDLKPANVMLTPTGEIKVLDFGLARQLSVATESIDTADPSDTADQPVEDDAAAARSLLLTQHERLVAGTPAYMSPEQARGDPVGPASDMYSLGLVLQELSTGHGPYEDGLSIDQLLDSARTGRTLAVAGLDRDLTRLIERLKSVEPVARPTAPETVSRLRWIRGKRRRRMRRFATSAIIGIVAIAGVKYTVDLRRERTQAIAARQDADDLVVFMLEELHDGLSGVGRLDILGSVSDKALAYLSSLPKADLGDDDLHRRGEALRQIGNVRMAEGDMPAAERAFTESLAIATDVVNRHPEHPQWLADLGESHFYIGYIRMERRDLTGALEQFDVYRDIADRLVELDGPKPQWRLEQAYAHNNRGVVYEKMGDLAAAAREIEASVAIKRSLVESDPENFDWRRSLANGLSLLATTKLEAGEHDGAEAARTEQLEIRRRLVEADPKHADDRLQLSRCHIMRGELRQRQRRCEEALGDFQEAQRIVKGLVEHDPANMAPFPFYFINN